MVLAAPWPGEHTSSRSSGGQNRVGSASARRAWPFVKKSSASFCPVVRRSPHQRGSAALSVTPTPALAGSSVRPVGGAGGVVLLFSSVGSGVTIKNRWITWSCNTSQATRWRFRHSHVGSSVIAELICTEI